VTNEACEKQCIQAYVLNDSRNIISVRQLFLLNFGNHQSPSNLIETVVYPVNCNSTSGPDSMINEGYGLYHRNESVVIRGSLLIQHICMCSVLC